MAETPIKIESIDNISNEVLDLLKEKLEGKSAYRVNDDRQQIVYGKKREYFLIANDRVLNDGIEWTLIWIGRNLWQYRYCNRYCTYKAQWKNPVDIVNEILAS